MDDAFKGRGDDIFDEIGPMNIFPIHSEMSIPRAMENLLSNAGPML